MSVKITYGADSNEDCSNLIEKWMQSIVGMLQSLPENTEYKTKIQQWCVMRESTIKTLEELIIPLKAWHDRILKCQLGGEVVSLVSDTVSVLSALLEIFGIISGTSAATIQDVGQAGGIAGGAVSTIAAGTKNILEEQKANEAASIIREDMTKSSKLLYFLESSEALKETVDKVLDFNLFCKVMDGFTNLYEEAKNAAAELNETPVTLPDDVVKMINNISMTKEEKEKVLDILLIIYKCYRCRKYLNTIINFRREHPFVLHSAYLITRVCLRLRNLQVPVSSLVSTIARGATAASETRGGAGGVIIPGVFVVIDVVNLLATKKELNEDDLELVKRIHEYMKIMKEELKLFKSFEEKYMDPTSDVDF